jgi:REP element-mobilizing transposase RayT
VKDGALFHIRIRVASTQQTNLFEADLASALLKSAADYHASGQWWCEIFLLMPDHLHALLTFPRESGMSVVVRNWKRGAARIQGVHWQDNFFDHRIRSKAEAQEKWHYIRRNPVAKGLCAREEYWPYWWAVTGEAR